MHGTRARQSGPRRPAHGAPAAAVPEQLAHVRDADGRRVLRSEGEGGKRDGGAGVVGFLADQAVGQDAEVLDAFADVEDQPGGGGEVGGGEDRDVRGGRGRLVGERGDVEGERGGGQAREDDAADAGWFSRRLTFWWFGRIRGGEGDVTVEGFAVDFFVALVLADEVMEILLWVPFGPDLVLFVNEVSRTL